MIAPIEDRRKQIPLKTDGFSRALLINYGPSGRNSTARRLVNALEAEGIPDVLPANRSDLTAIPTDPSTLILVGCGTGEAEALEALARYTPHREVGTVILALPQESCRILTARALALGADDVVPPPHTADAILFRAYVASWKRQSLRARVSTEPLRVGRISVDLKTRSVKADGRPITLSGREFELLLRLMEANGAPVRRDRLVTDIWGEGTNSGTALEATVHRLRRKLEATSLDSDLLTTVRGVGYRLAV